MGDIVQTTETRRGNGHLAVYLVYPLLSGVGLAGLFALAAGGRALVEGSSWEVVLRTAGGRFFGTLWVGAVVFVYALLRWGGPLQLNLTLPERDDEPEERWGIRGGMRWARRHPALPSGLDLDLRRQGPKADPAIERLYRFIATMWPTGEIGQEHCRAKGFTRKWWDLYVGGSRARRKVGTESGRGLLDRAGVIRKDGNKWVICAPLNEALAISDELLAYAEARAQVVSGRVG